MSTSTSKTVFILLSTLLFIGVSFCAFRAQKALKTYVNDRSELAQKMDFKKRLLDMQEWLGKDEHIRQKLAVANRLEKQLAQNRAAAFQFSMYAGIGLVAYMGIMIFLFRERSRFLCASLLVAALSCLLPGIILPMLELSALVRDLVVPIDGGGLIAMALGNEKHFQGDIYFYFQCKSVVELIQLLFEQRNLVVGVSILLFSVIIPILKLSASAIVLINPAGKSKLYKLVSYIGKWSMADVFVAAMFLSYLAFNNMNPGIETESKILPGLYFFLAYCIFSIASSYFLPKDKA